MTDNSEPAREAVACLYTVQGDSQPFMRISRGMLHAAGDIVAVQPLGPLPASPAPDAGGLEAVREALAEELRQFVGNYWRIKTAAATNPVFMYEHHARLIERTIAALASPAATRGEPVAWVQPGYLSMLQKYGSCSMRAEPIEAMDYIVPVYGAPPAPAVESAQVKEAFLKGFSAGESYHNSKWHHYKAPDLNAAWASYRASLAADAEE